MRIAARLLPLVLLASCATQPVAREARVAGAAQTAAVSAADPRAADAGRQMLLKGGTAADAAIATLLALTVVEPQSSGVGGGSFLVYHDAKTGLATYDGREEAPGAATPALFLGPDGKPPGSFNEGRTGGRAVGVPGNIAAIALAHRRHGKLPWATLFGPAIGLARDGFEVSPRFHGVLESYRAFLGSSPQGRALYYQADGSPKPVGSVVRNPELAAFFEEIAKRGAAHYYKGPPAERLVRAVQTSPTNPGRMTTADVAAYEAKPRAPVCGTYRAYRICGMGPPSSGGPAVYAILKQLERFDLPTRKTDDPITWHLVAESMRLAYADRAKWIADPDHTPVPTAGLMSDAYLASRSALISPTARMAKAEAGTPPGAPALASAPDTEAAGTSSFSAADAMGNVAAMTSTVEAPFGAGLIVDGYVLNNELTDFNAVPDADGKPTANRVEPGKRPRSSMAPMIAYGPDGKPVLSIGAAGGATIIAQVAKAMIGVLDWKMSVQDAIAMPQLVAMGDTVRVEKGTNLEGMIPALAALGHKAQATDLPLKANGVERTAGGWRGGADPRSEGESLAFDQAERRGDRPFLWRKVEGQWRSTSWREAAAQVASLATALRAIGISRGDRVVLVSENRPEWCLADLGIMAAGAVTVPTYTTNTERDHVHILENSGAKAAIVSTAKLAKTLLPAVYQSECCTTVIGIEPLRIGQSSAAQLHDWGKLLADHPGDVAAVRAEATKLERSDLACLIYTSGTGGAPRGVRQHHGAILTNVAGCIDIIEHDFPKGDTEVFLSFLPTSHAYEHSAGQFLPIGLGGEIYYSEGLEKLAANIEEVRPTIMVVVPRLFEVLRTRISKNIEKAGGLPAKLLGQALRLGRKRHEGGLPLWDRPLNLILDRTIRKKVRQRFGGRLKAMVSGGAPLNPEVGIFFAALDLTILQGYGQTEAAPVISCNRPASRPKLHSVGRPLKGVEVKIAPDGEILVAGELVMHGYWQNEAETARVLKGGWLHTGDIGHLDEDGHIVITDRKKDIIVNDKGDNVAPQRVEGMLTLQPEILQAMVYGDRRPYLVGLVVPDPEWAAEWAQANGLPNDAATLKADPDFHRAVTAAVDRVNAQLSVIEKVRRVILADEAFAVENEMMTPSLKIRRHVIRQKYGEKLDALYG